MLYAVVTTIAMLASCYLLFRRANAIAPDVTPPVRLRRWTAAFFAVFVVNHLWYLGPTFFLTSDDDVKLTNMIGILLDSMTFFPLSIIVLLVMLQDRRRPLWPVAVIVAPLIIGMVWCVVWRSDALFPLLNGYLLLMSICLIIYMVRALQQYGRWLRDNYADLEHKEVWQSFVVLAVILLVFAIYVLSGGSLIYEFILQAIVIVLICYLLWRVETLSDLSNPQPQSLPADETTTEEIEDNSLSPTIRDNIEALLQQHCIDTQLYLQHDLTTIRDNIEALLQQHCIDAQLYLQHDLTVSQLAQAIGINRLYLSQYFSRQGISYNAYINDLRINHFVSLYREAVAAQRHFTAQQLAHDSGYQSYSTFSLAFKQRMGQSVTVWMRSAD